MRTRSRLILETVGALVGVFLITIGFLAVHPLVVSTRNVSLIILVELSLSVILVGFLAVLNKLAKRPMSEGFGFRWRPLGKQVAIGLAIFAVTISFIILPLLLGVDRSMVLSFKARSGLVLAYYVIRAFFFVGFGEELVWRGYFFERTREITGSGAWAAVLSALLFGLWHFPSSGDILQVAATAGIGLVYGIARWKIRDCSTVATGIAHGLHDATIVVLSYVLL